MPSNGPRFTTKQPPTPWFLHKEPARGRFLYLHHALYFSSASSLSPIHVSPFDHISFGVLILFTLSSHLQSHHLPPRTAVLLCLAIRYHIHAQTLSLQLELQALINSLTYIKILMPHPCLHDFIVAHSTLAHDCFFYSFILVFLVTYLCLSLNCICLSCLLFLALLFALVSYTSLEICLSLSSLLVDRKSVV